MRKIAESDALDVSEEAEQEGVNFPVMIDAALAQTLEPTPFLSSLGVTVGGRIENLLKQVNAYITVAGEEKTLEKQRYYIPFMALKGPLVREDFLPVFAIVHTDKEGKQAITLTQNGDGYRQ
jgi:hypothetical protein